MTECDIADSLCEHFRVTFAEGRLPFYLMREDDDRVLPVRDLYLQTL